MSSRPQARPYPTMDTIMKITAFFLTASLTLASTVHADTLKGWTKDKGFGWVWGRDDQLRAIQAVLSPDRVLNAVQSVKKGKVYDLGVPLDRHSYKWPGHSATSIVSFRSPVGVKTEKDIGVFTGHVSKLAFHSCALYISDNLGTQIDGLGHITKGEDNHWYNGFKEIRTRRRFRFTQSRCGWHSPDHRPCGDGGRSGLEGG